MSNSKNKSNFKSDSVVVKIARMRICFICIFVCLYFCVFLNSVYAKSVRVDIEKNLQALLEEEDTDNDNKLTVDDFPMKGTARGDGLFILYSSDGDPYPIYGTYYLSNCLQELILLKEQGLAIGLLDAERIYGPPVSRISRMIRDYYWHGLTRRIDAMRLSEVLTDSKVPQQEISYLYVPAGDDFAYEYFSQASADNAKLKLNVVRLPKIITPEYVKNLQDSHGLLALALPCVFDAYRFRDCLADLLGDGGSLGDLDVRGPVLE